MKFLSVCSGIEAASVAWEPLGWSALAFSEIESFPRAVLKHHYPDTPLFGDFTKLRDEQFIADADILVGGTPCQAFSVAGLRQSLSDDRGNLSLEFVRLANATLQCGARMSAADAINNFIHAMEVEGVRPVEPIAQRLMSGELIRFRCDGDGKGRLNGWAVVYLDERPAGAFGNYRMGLSRKWKSGDDTQLSPEERLRLRREWAEAKQRRSEEREQSEREAAVEALEMWSSGAPAGAGHAYVVKKRLDPTPLRERDGKLLIPMVDGAGTLWNLQRIAEDGTKRFLRGGRTDGLFTIIGEFTRCGETCCIGEGYATMAAVHRASGYPCVAAFSAKNMAAVARLWNAARPDLHFIVCADDDSHLETNVGLKAAQAVAEEIGAKVALPLVPPDAEAA